MNSASTGIVFNGMNGNECEAFVTAIRDLAWSRRKERGYYGILNVATIGLRGKALRWHAKLDRSVQEDWNSFFHALFEEYPSVKQQERTLSNSLSAESTLGSALSVAVLSSDHTAPTSFADAPQLASGNPTHSPWITEPTQSCACTYVLSVPFYNLSVSDLRSACVKPTGQ